MGQSLATILFAALVDGSLYALIGVGFVLLFRSTGVINFAQGAFMALAGYFFLVLTQTAGLPWYLSLAGTIVLAGGVGVISYFAAFRRLVGAPLFALVIATLGLATILTVFMSIIWGPEIRPLPPQFAPQPLFRLAGAPFTRLDLFSVVMAVVLVGAVEVGLHKSRLGTRMRAVANSSLLAGLMRINIHRMSATAWGVSAGLTGAAGVAYSLRAAVDPVSAQNYGLVAFAAVLLGGLDSFRGAVIGGLILAAAQSATVIVLGGQWASVVAYVVLLLILFVRPQGIFGSPNVVRL